MAVILVPGMGNPHFQCPYTTWPALPSPTSTHRSLNSAVTSSAGGKTVTYVSTGGIYTNTLGQAEAKAKLVERAKNLGSYTHQGNSWVIGDTTTGARYPIFIYDLATKKVKNFSLQVKDTVSASLTKDGTAIAFDGKDTAGKATIYLSSWRLTTIRANALPTGYTSCDHLTLAPGGTWLAMLCQKSSTEPTVLIVAPVKNGALGKATVFTKTDFTPGPIAWLTETTFTTIGTNLTFSIDGLTYTYTVKMAQGSIKNGKPTLGTPTAIDTTSVIPAGQMIIAPLQIEKLSATKVIYVLEYVATDGQPIFSTVIGTFRTDTKTNKFLVHQPEFSYLAELKM